MTKGQTVSRHVCIVLTHDPSGAVEQMSRVLAKDLGSRSITVNTVSPGPMDTGLFRDGKPQKLLDTIAGFHPGNRIGQPEEVAPLVAFLASPAAQWINGQNIKVNGVCGMAQCNILFHVLILFAGLCGLIHVSWNNA